MGNLLDSLYRCYPVGYLIASRNPTVTASSGDRAHGRPPRREVLTKDYETVRIRIAFNPQEERPDRQRARRRPLVVV